MWLKPYVKSRATVYDVACAMQVSEQFVRVGLQKGVFPWGYAVKVSGDRWTYWINRKKFEEVTGLMI